MKNELLKHLRNNLKPRKNRNYLVWFQLHKLRLGDHKHHLLQSRMGKTGKLNDFLLVSITSEVHHRVHQAKGYKENEFDELMVEAIENIQDYAEHLQEKLNK